MLSKSKKLGPLIFNNISSTMMKSRSLRQGSDGSNDGDSYDNGLGVTLPIILILIFSVVAWGCCHNRIERLRALRSSERSKKMALKKIRKGVVVKVSK